MVKKMGFMLMICGFTLSLCVGCTKNAEIDYGQTPPGLIPEVFAPNVISMPDDYEFGGTFTPDGKEIYYTKRKNKMEMPIIMTSQLVNGVWSTPTQLEIEGFDIVLEPHLTADGNTLYFGAVEQLEGRIIEEDAIWKLERTENGWGNLTHVTSGMYVSTTMDGSIYLTDIGNRLGLVKLPFDGTAFGERIRLNGGPNKPVRGIHPCIAKDESFIIYDCERPDGYGGEGDLYVSFNLGENQWSEGFNLGPEINSEGVEFAAQLSPDNKYLFFTKNDDLCWVDIAVIEPFRSLATK